jgi:bifunctional DNA-binding transcriptional regulator/antitoxin component of YhaV-PrlF toxin-antitoxin module
MLSLTIEAKVGKKYALYLPKAVVKALSLKEGGRVLLRVSGRTVTVESLQDPFELALHGKKFASITPDQVEAVSIGEQRSDVQVPS